MSKHFTIVPALLLAAALVDPAAASAQDWAGKWIAEYPTRVRNINGAASGEEMGQAVLSIEVKGDSIFGTWQVQNSSNPGKPRAIRGTVIDGRINFVSDPVEVTIRRNMGGDDSQTQMRMITYYDGTLKDGAIEGTFRGESEDKTVQMPPLKWVAKRDVGK